MTRDCAFFSVRFPVRRMGFNSESSCTKWPEEEANGEKPGEHAELDREDKIGVIKAESEQFISKSVGTSL